MTQGDEEHSDVTDEPGFINVNISPIDAKEWAVPTLEHDLSERLNSLRSAIESSGDNYIEFLQEHQDELVVFFTIASELLNDLGKELFTQEVLADKHRDKEGVNERALVEQLGEPKKFEMLKHYRVISDELFQYIKDTQDYRARLVHDPQKRHRITDLEILDNRISTAVEAVNGLSELLE